MGEGRNRLRLGALELLVVSDGTFQLDAGNLFGVVPRVTWEPLAGPLDEQHRLTMHLNSLVVRSGGGTVLIETGLGNKPGNPYQGGGRLLQNLAAEGIRPQEIDVVINTHLHADHCGWNTVLRDGVALPTFPSARYYLQHKEWEDATHPNERTRAAYLAHNLLPLEEAGQLELVDGERQVTPEVRILPNPGHTEGHAVVAITSGGETAVYLGDMAQHVTQLERFPWTTAFDVLPLVSLETKKRVITQAIEGNHLLIVPHLPFPGAGRIRMENGRRRWEFEA